MDNVVNIKSKSNSSLDHNAVDTLRELADQIESDMKNGIDTYDKVFISLAGEDTDGMFYGYRMAGCNSHDALAMMEHCKFSMMR